MSVCLVVLASPATSQDQWIVTQITHTTTLGLHDGRQTPPTLSADGSVLAFYSNSNLGGTNPEGTPELFLYSVQNAAFERLTTGTVSLDNALPLARGPFLSSDGTVVLYHSTAEMWSSAQWYLLDIPHGVRQPLPGIGVFLNPSGTFALFYSAADLVGQNPDGSAELFRYDFPGGTVTQLTNDDSLDLGDALPAASDSGDVVFLLSIGDLVPGSNPEGYIALFKLDVTSGSYRQYTHGPISSSWGDFSVTRDGSRLVWCTGSDITGENPDHSPEVFLIYTASGEISQVTDDHLPLGLKATITPDGATVAINSSYDLTGGNPDNSTELFLYDVATATTTQATDTPEPPLGLVSWTPAVNASATMAAFTSANDFTGENPDGNTEVFLLTREQSAAPGIQTLTVTGLILLAILIATLGTAMLHRLS